MKPTMILAEVKRNLMNYTAFNDQPGHFLTYRNYVGAVSKATGGLTGKVNKIVADQLIQNGDVRLIGKVYVVMKNQESK
jgi:hypothetical protein